MEVQAEEEQAFLARQQAALSGLKDPTRSPTTRNQASTGPVIQVIPFINRACSSCCVLIIGLQCSKDDNVTNFLINHKSIKPSISLHCYKTPITDYIFTWYVFAIVHITKYNSIHIAVSFIHIVDPLIV